MYVSIYNQCTVFNLINRGYFSNGAGWCWNPPRRVDAGNIMSVGWIPFLSTFECVLMYELEREYVKFDNLPELTHVLFVVAWKSESYKKFHVFVHLIKHSEYIDWNEIKLREYYQRHANQLCMYTGPIKDTWLIDDDIVLMTELELDSIQRDGVLDIIVSEGIGDGHIKQPVWVNPER
jgi:hypothetical protein